MKTYIYRKTFTMLHSLAFTYLILLFILLAGLVVRIYKINSPLADWHSWRQVDTASVSKTFLENGINLLRPRYHDVSSVQTGYFNPEGYRFVEFPIFNLFHSILFRALPILSFEAWGRMVSAISALLTCCFLFGIGYKRYGKAVGLLSAFYYALLPFNIYFTRVILPDPMSVMFGMGAIFWFLTFIDSEKKRYLFTSAIFLGLGMLVKPHAIFFIIPILYLYFSKYTLSDLFRNKWLFIALNIAFVPLFLWRTWMYQPGYIKGIAHWEWSFNGNGIRFRPAFWRWIFGERFGKLILGVWGAFPFVYGALLGKKKLTLVHAFLLQTFLYVSIFATANVMHDYYQIFVIPAVAFTLAVGTKAIWDNKDFNPVIGKLLLLFVVALMFGMSFYGVKDNYRINDTGAIAAGQEADLILPKDALVIAPYNGDTTFLYQTKRWGWPAVTTSIDELIEEGADYFISVNLTDKDTVDFSKRFEAIRQTDKFVILDLHKEKES